jgi:hypothetical protein
MVYQQHKTLQKWNKNNSTGALWLAHFFFFLPFLPFLPFFPFFPFFPFLPVFPYPQLVPPDIALR